MRATSRASWVTAMAALAAGTRAQSSCNGQASFCQRSYANITFIGAHDSPNVAASSLAANQNYTATTQLDNGVRMLTGQGHNSGGTIHLCHSTCSLLDVGPLTDYLQEVKSWLDSNPNDVVTMLWVNSDNLPVSQWASAYQSAGLVDVSYVPTATPMTLQSWPTLGSMISSGKRLVTFIDNGADQASVPYILDEFSQMWETPYDETDTSFPCNVDRITAGVDQSTILYTVNHFLDVNITGLAGVTIPARSALDTTNAQSGTGSLGLQASQCASQHGRNPNFMLVDYYDMPTDGAVFKVAASLNGVTWNGSIGNGTSSTTTSSSGAASTASVESTPLGNKASVASASPPLVVLAGLVALARLS